jgi:hypothetical protein
MVRWSGDGVNLMGMGTKYFTVSSSTLYPTTDMVSWMLRKKIRVNKDAAIASQQAPEQSYTTSNEYYIPDECFLLHLQNNCLHKIK